MHGYGQAFGMSRDFCTFILKKGKASGIVFPLHITLHGFVNNRIQIRAFFMIKPITRIRNEQDGIRPEQPGNLPEVRIKTFQGSLKNRPMYA